MSLYVILFKTGWLVRSVCVTIICLSALICSAEEFTSDIKPLIDSACIDCHDEDTETRLNFTKLGSDLLNPKVYKAWVNIFDRIDSGEMPPKKKKRPDPKLLSKALSSLKSTLLKSNRKSQMNNGRVPVRRMTRLEYEYSLQDLLHIKTPIQHSLPAENGAGFDTVSEKQGISPLHIRQYMTAAKTALDSAIHSGRNPSRKFTVNYRTSKSTQIYIDYPWSNGGDSLKKVSDAIVSFKSSDFIYRTDRNGFIAKKSGNYKVTADVYAYQARTPVTLLLYRAKGQLSQPALLRAFDIPPGKSRTVKLTAYFDKGEYIIPSFMNLLPQKDGKGIFNVVNLPADKIGRARIYKGEGIAIRKIDVVGPLNDKWPPQSTLALLPGRDKTIIDIIKEIGGRAFRRPLTKVESEYYQSLAMTAIQEKKTPAEAVKTAFTALFSSPQFLFLSEWGNRDYFLASRLSFFLWKSIPDDRLLALAAEGELSKPEILEREVDRMIQDERFGRFIKDFTGQWLRLYDIDATTPDKKVYREYDDLLRQSMIDESELFFGELVKNNLSALNLIDADFTFANKRLSRHYQLPMMKSQNMKKIKLPGNSIRGGILSQAAIHKVTANGTVTSPVRRGNFILQNLTGKAVPPPPPNVGSIEPDIRGKKGIKEILKAHRNTPDCFVCHSRIDPPGFALESFDVIGGYRIKYRNQKGKAGIAKVDSSGITSGGHVFKDFSQYKKIMLADEIKSGPVTRQLIKKLVVYSTGGEIQFADREEIEDIFQHVKKNGSRLRDIIHAIVQSPLFGKK